MKFSLREALLKEQSKKQFNMIVAYIGEDEKRFGELMKLFFEGEYRLTQRAAWPMSGCAAQHPRLILPYLPRLIKNLDRQTQHPAVVRNTLRLLQTIEVPKRLHGKLMSTCFEFVQTAGRPAAIKAFALTVLQNLSKQYPEILPELKLIIADRAGTESAAFRQRAKRIK